MYAIPLDTSSNMRAMAGSIAIHVFVAAWFLSSATPVEITPQQMIKVTLVAAPSAEPVEQKPTVAPQPTLKESPRAMQKAKAPSWRIRRTAS